MAPVKRKTAAAKAAAKKGKTAADGAVDEDDNKTLDQLANCSKCRPETLVFHRDATKMKNLLAYRASAECKKALMIISI